MAHFESKTGTSGMEKTQAEMQQFLDAEQYAEKQILKYEACFGAGYMSAGGEDTVREYTAMLGDLPRGARVLDIGSGVGGSAFYFADHFGADVLGIDLATNSVNVAKRRAATRPAPAQGSYEFKVLDATKAEFPEGHFDVIYSRDTLLHIAYEDKPALFKKIHSWLKPRGQLLLSDYGKGAKSAEKMSERFTAYCKKRGYYMLTPQEYADLCVTAGFDRSKVDSQDRSWQYCTVSRTEIDRIRLAGPGRDAFIAEYSEKELDEMVSVFADKVDMTVVGDRSFIMLHAVKAPIHDDLRKAVCAACKAMYAEGLVLGTDGNVSARVAPGSDLIIIKPSGVPYEDLTPDHMVMCTTGGVVAPGEPPYKPSSEINLHTGVYRSRSDVNAVVHTHGMYAGTLACCHMDLICAHYSVGELTGDDRVRCSSYHTYGTPELGAACVEYLGGRQAVLLANHGAVCVGSDLAMAEYNARRLERECEMYTRCRSLVGHSPVIVSDAGMAACRVRDQTYGQVEAPQEGAGGGQMKCC